MENCPECGTELKPMGGCSAHPDNWYCDNPDCAWRCKGQTAPRRPAVSDTWGRLSAIRQQLEHAGITCEDWDDTRDSEAKGVARLERERDTLRAEVERLKHRCDSLDLDRAAAVVALEGICESPMVVSGQPREFLAALDKGRTVWRRCVEKDAALLRDGTSEPGGDE